MQKDRTRKRKNPRRGRDGGSQQKRFPI